MTIITEYKRSIEWMSSSLESTDNNEEKNIRQEKRKVRKTEKVENSRER